jgi:hypothetical protein
VQPATEHLASHIGGFVAAEGTFLVADRGGRVQARFAVALAAVDTNQVERLREFFGCGHIVRSPRRRPHYDDEVRYEVCRLRDLVEVVVPFMDSHLPCSYKRAQYLRWRAALIEYWEQRAKRVRPCTVPGCEKPRRAHGLCRHHLYAVRGQ